MKTKALTIIMAVALLAGACGKGGNELDGLRRSRADALNKEAFQNRFRDADHAEAAAREALAYIDDSLPAYDDGRLRAWNNLATTFYLKSQRDSLYRYLDTVLHYEGNSRNREIEQLLAELLEARMLQRDCDIAGSYKILNQIQQSGVLDKEQDDWLYSLAKSEFYITSSLLNYFNRIDAQRVRADLLEEMEAWRPRLRCDYEEDMSFNHALAYGYCKLCRESDRQTENVQKTLSYCYENLRLMEDNGSRMSTYHLGNTFIALGFLFSNEEISEVCWDSVQEMTLAVYDIAEEAFDVTFDDPDDWALAFFAKATDLFADNADPYERLGAAVATGRHLLTTGDTALAREYLLWALEDSTQYGMAPIYEAQLYECLLASGCAESPEEVAEWTGNLVRLLNYIKENERADFALQQQVEEMQRNSRNYMISSIVLIAVAILLAVLMVMLRRRTKALQQETQRLKEAERQDIERIANVETCLSVLRHDINPFVSYLQNEKLPDELRREVTGQLIRTFENIKNWTHLSIPSGLQFRCAQVALQEVFDRVESCINNFRGDALRIDFQPTTAVATGDGQLLEIMLRNLVNNAIQYSEQGSVTISATAYGDDSRFVEVVVRDTGRGMDEAELESLFRADKPVKTQPTAQGYGSGFGLLLCRYIVKLHDDNTLRGCRIWAESTPGEGTAFRFLVAAAEQQ